MQPTSNTAGQSLLSAPAGERAGATKNQLGTINGCYIPCLLNILGAPLFLFVGFSVGMMGWPGALALFCYSETIAYLTIGSFSALVTNGRMRGGGAYYMISRSLGPAFGGSSGLLFWLAYCVNVTFNTVAFTDTVFETWFPKYKDCTLEAKNGHCWYKLAFSTATLFVLFLIAYRGAAAFARVNYFIYAGLVVALIVSIGSLWLDRTTKRIVPDMYHPTRATKPCHMHMHTPHPPAARRTPPSHPT
jgi:amino acid transporter